MTNKNTKEIDFSLSEEEKNDLDRMIQDFNRERSALLKSTSNDEVDKQLQVMKERFDQISDVILKINDRVDSLYEILQLMHQKSEILNSRIEELRDAI
jgi:predicted CopG family antitoxin